MSSYRCGKHRNITGAEEAPKVIIMSRHAASGTSKNFQTKLKSSWLKGCVYDPQSKELTLVTKKGDLILCSDVDERDHWLFTHSPPGKFYHHHLKSKVVDGVAFDAKERALQKRVKAVRKTLKAEGWSYDDVERAIRAGLMSLS